MNKYDTSNQKNVVALGKFDGIHIGHRKLIETAVSAAKTKNMKTLVYTIVSEGGKSITGDLEKEKIILGLGADSVIKQMLTDDFRSLAPEEFVKKILVEKLCAGHIVVGYNFKFGVNRSGNADTLLRLCKKYDLGITVIESVNAADESGNYIPVSSTRIRSLIEIGRMEEAKRCLGRCFSISGTVSEGKKLGRTIGFPTVNIYPNENVLVPKHGVYAVKLSMGGESYTAVANVGINPTVENGGNIKVESYIFNYSGKDLYGEFIKVEFIEFVRPEINFGNLELLKNQIEKDKQYVKRKYYD